MDIYLLILQGVKIQNGPLWGCGAKRYIVLSATSEQYRYIFRKWGRLWRKLLPKRLEEAKFKCGETDMCLCYYLQDDDVAIVGVHEDDLVVTASGSWTIT